MVTVSTAGQLWLVAIPCYNDENLLEITESPRLAGIYLAEFLRLYEHYRARMAFDRRQAATRRRSP
jgi:hypothetical protein